MRLLHTADWHLGRLLHGASLVEDQAHALDQVVDAARDAAVDAVLVSGDIYDRAVPPPEAVTLLDDVLARLVLGLHIPVVLIAGNHDSPRRLDFASRVLREQGLHVRAWPEAEPVPITLADAHGPVSVLAVPFAEPSVVRERIESEEIADHDTALRVLTRRARAAIPPGNRSVLMAHAFVAGGMPTESERPLSVGGSGRVGVGRFRGFDYVALGHLHRPQRLMSDRIWYSGSLLRYSFEESTHQKSLNLVEIGADGSCTVEPIELTPRREVRCVRGSMEELLAGPEAGASADDYLHVTVLDRQPVHDPLGRLRAVYPNLLQLERPFDRVVPDPTGMVDHRRVDDRVLFERFFVEVTGQSLSEAERAAFDETLADLRAREREASA